MRDVKYDRQLGRLATLTTTGAVQLWDPHLSPIRTVRGFPNTSTTSATYCGVLVSCADSSLILLRSKAALTWASGQPFPACQP